jgi:ATPase family AAA domain-containing protein 3A/B
VNTRLLIDMSFFMGLQVRVIICAEIPYTNSTSLILSSSQHYFPKGTGKTMVARKLAKCIGMDYALMSGGDVGPLGSDAVTQIHNLFTWSKLSRRGVLLFIDESEAFLASRKKANMSEMTHNALNALLYHTGGERRDFMLVLATNR